MNTIFPLIIAALALPVAVLAQERTAGQAYDAQVNWASLKSSIDMVSNQNKAIAATVTAIGEKLDAIEACGKQGKIWNGSGCADAGGDLEVGTFSETNVYGGGCRTMGNKVFCSTFEPASASDAYCKGKGYDALVSNVCSSRTVAGGGNHDSPSYSYVTGCTLRCIRTK